MVAPLQVVAEYANKTLPMNVSHQPDYSTRWSPCRLQVKSTTNRTKYLSTVTKISTKNAQRALS